VITNPYQPWKFLLEQVNTWDKVQTFSNGINVDGPDSLLAAVDGQIFHYDKKFYLTSGNQRVISRASGAMVTPVTIADTTTETTLYEGSVLSNTLSVGKVYRVSVFGAFSTVNASVTLTVRTKLNGVELASITSALGQVTGVAGFTQAYITTRSTGATGAVSCFSSFQLDEKSFIANNSSVTLDTTSGNSVQITGQWSVANASNTVTADQGLLEAMN